MDIVLIAYLLEMARDSKVNTSIFVWYSESSYWIRFVVIGKLKNSVLPVVQISIDMLVFFSSQSKNKNWQYLPCKMSMEFDGHHHQQKSTAPHNLIIVLGLVCCCFLSNCYFHGWYMAPSVLWNTEIMQELQQNIFIIQCI